MIESVDSYSKVLFYITHAIRVIECRNSIQWILQRKDDARCRWRAVGYFRTRNALIREVWKLGQNASQLYQLPERFESRPEGGWASVQVDRDTDIEMKSKAAQPNILTLSNEGVEHD